MMMGMGCETFADEVDGNAAIVRSIVMSHNRGSENLASGVLSHFVRFTFLRDELGKRLKLVNQDQV